MIAWNHRRGIQKSFSQTSCALSRLPCFSASVLSAPGTVFPMPAGRGGGNLPRGVLHHRRPGTHAARARSAREPVPYPSERKHRSASGRSLRPVERVLPLRQAFPVERVLPLRQAFPVHLDTPAAWAAWVRFMPPRTRSGCLA